ncbi:MAG: DUF4128 domain-containing protein [Candidatus Thiodiazotropha endolucinida]|nr:DUF4128 domain-containing protein [Candidatus Thiodiazotropha taylori]MCW4321600.1 DUF4128 domain-containing protein [Candidatus Thiodiazotropha taylori]
MKQVYISNINSAFSARAKARLGEEIEVTYENILNKKHTVTAPWILVSMGDIDTEPFTLGSGGLDINRGSTKLDFFYPLNEGLSPIIKGMDQAREVFNIGVELSEGGTVATVTRLNQSRYTRGHASFRSALQVFWTALTQRE